MVSEHKHSQLECCRDPSNYWNYVPNWRIQVSNCCATGKCRKFNTSDYFARIMKYFLIELKYTGFSVKESSEAIIGYYEVLIFAVLCSRAFNKAFLIYSIMFRHF